VTRTVLVPVRLIVIKIVTSSLTHSLTAAPSRLAFELTLYIYNYLETRSVSRRRRFENKRGMGESKSRSSKTDRRLRRLEKTVESLSHGLILALTQLKSGNMHADTEPHRPHHRPGHPDVPNDEIGGVSADLSVEDDDSDGGGDLSTVFARLGFTENCTKSFILMLVVLDH
jgi:hypothetical protein